MITPPPSSISTSLIDQISSTLEKTGNSHRVYNHLSEKIDRLWPDAAVIGRAIREDVERDEYALVDTLELSNYTPGVRDVLLEAIFSHVGCITAHDNTENRILWDVKDRAATLDRKPTFSEQAGECPLHTDSAFSEIPEKYVCLYVVQESGDGGGESVIVPIESALSQLSAEPDGPRCIDYLRQDGYPHRTPDAFSSQEKVIISPILGESPTIRFRYDCLIDGFSLRDETSTEEHLWAVEYFKNFLEERVNRFKFLVKSDQLIVINNLTVLHARTNYQDPNRHLMRARLHPLPASDNR